jgi:hypothetical protein
LPTEQGQIFREAWIAGVRKHYPGEPKPGYVAPWDETPDWEREARRWSSTRWPPSSRSPVDTPRSSAECRRGSFVALCWSGQIFKHFSNPKPSYVAGWDDLPQWQQETDADIFERIEQALNQ